jgi:chromosomal replication initiator protein
MDSVWEDANRRIQESLTEHHFKTWFSPIRFVSRDDHRIVLQVPNRFFKDWLIDYYLPLIEETLQSITDRQLRVQFEIAPGETRAPIADESEQVRESAVAPLVSRARAATSDHPLNPKYTFDTFIPGSSNQFAHAAAQAVATKPAGTYNPLFIYGGVGLGKTHLLNAIGHEILKSHPRFKICYVSAEQFMNELIRAIRDERMIEFRAKYRDSCDMLLMDDVQFIAGKERTQEEFFHTFNTLYEGHKQIVLTSDQFPKEIPGFAERLQSRFEWGLIADIQAPDTETKVAILKKKAAEHFVPLPDDVALFLAENIDSNIRKLEGSLISVGAFASLTGSQITIPLAQEVLQKHFRDQKPIVTIDSIQKIVAKHFNLKIQDLKSSRKLKSLTLPRQIAMYLCRELTTNSFPRIGEEFGRRDHSTVIHAVKTIAAKMKTDSTLRDAVAILEKEIQR